MPTGRWPDLARRIAALRSFPLLLGMVNTAYRKTSLHRDRPKQSLRLASSDRQATGGADDAPHRLRFPMPSDDADVSPVFRAYPFFTMSRQPLPWSSGTETLRRWTHLARSLVEPD